MNSIKLTSAVSIIANLISSNLTPDEIAIVSSIFVQLGDTLATIGAQRSLCCEDDEKEINCR